MHRRALVLAIAMIGSARSIVHAEPDRERTQAAMEGYFSGEERGGYVLVGMGATGLLAGGLLCRDGRPILRGMSFPLLGLGLAHVAAGIFVNVSSHRRVATFTQEIATDPAGFISRERPRMRGVSRQFTVLKIVEVALIAGGLGTAAWARHAGRKKLEGAGYGLAIEAGLTLGFDIVAASRANGYRDDLAAVDAAGSTAFLITHGGEF